MSSLPLSVIDLPENDFLANTKLLLQNKYNKQSGFIAYAYLAHKKQLEIEANRNKKDEVRKKSEYVGTIGDRITIEIILEAKFSFEGFYGYQNLYLFKDDEDNIYKWKTGVYLVNSKGMNIEIGDKISLKGTIKGHEEYKGTKQTELTRCKQTK